jgi:hypothetical protein
MTVGARFPVTRNVFLQRVFSFGALWVTHASSIHFDGPDNGSQNTTKHGEAVACQKIMLPALSREYTGVRQEVRTGSQTRLGAA